MEIEKGKYDICSSGRIHDDAVLMLGDDGSYHWRMEYPDWCIVIEDEADWFYYKNNGCVLIEDER